MPPPSAPPAQPRNAELDGRVARGERTRRALAEALIALLEEGDPQPTARRVADRAGVSLRLVFHHFEDMEQVLQTAVAVQVERHWSRIRPVSPHLSQSERIARVSRQRASVFEAIAPVRRAAAAVEPTSAVVAGQLAQARLLLRGQVEHAFAAELDRAGTRRAHLLDALEVAASWETWEQLRRRLGHAPATARRLVATLMAAVIDTAACDRSTASSDTPPTRGGNR